MASKVDHLAWAEEHLQPAESLWESDDLVSRRWSAVVAYYAILRFAHAIAADHWGEHPTDHFEVRDVATRLDPTRSVLAANIQEAMILSFDARYLDAGVSAERWFQPSYESEEQAADRALELMRTLVPEFEADGLGLDAHQFRFGYLRDRDLFPSGVEVGACREVGCEPC